MLEHPRWLAENWRIALECGLDDGRFASEHAEEICLLIATCDPEDQYEEVKRRLKVMLLERGLPPSEQSKWYNEFQEIWGVLTTEVKPRNPAWPIHLEWLPEYNKLVAEHFKGANSKTWHVRALLRALKWTKEGRWICKAQFLSDNKRPAGRLSSGRYQVAIEQTWRLLQHIVKSLPRQLHDPVSYAPAPIYTQNQLAKLSDYLAQPGRST